MQLDNVSFCYAVYTMVDICAAISGQDWHKEMQKVPKHTVKKKRKKKGRGHISFSISLTHIKII